MRVIRVGICVLVAFAVLAHGAVEAWSASILEIGVAALFSLWGFLVFRGQQAELRWNALGWPLISFSGLALIQYFAGLSAYPYLTKIELLKLAAYLLLFFLTLQSFRTSDEWRGLVWFLLILGFAVALFGIAQHLTFNGKLYWFRELRYGGVPFGPYVNRNHFAGLMELIVPMGLAILILRVVGPDQWPLVALLTVLPVGALFLSASRGGITSFLVQLGIMAILIRMRRGERKHLGAAAVVLLLAGMLVAWLGVGRTLERFSKLQSLEVSEGRRWIIIKDSFRIIYNHPLLGTGLGTFIVVYPKHESFYDGKVVNHAHNEYVEALAETGLLGGLCGLFFIVILVRLSLANLRSSASSFELAVHIGSFVACAGLLVHSLVDFNLHIPSNALLFLLQAASTTSHFQSPRATAADLPPRPFSVHFRG